MCRAAVVVAVTEVSGLVLNDLQRLTHVDQRRGQTRQTGDSVCGIQYLNKQVNTGESDYNKSCYHVVTCS